MNKDLQKAYEAIQAGKRNEAFLILEPIIRVRPNNADAWYLLGFVLLDHEKRIHAFEQVLRLDPDNQPAQRQLAKLRNNGPLTEPIAGAMQSFSWVAPVSKRRALPLGWILIGVGILLLMVLAAGGWLLLQTVHPADSLPTPSQPIVMDTLTPALVTATAWPTVTQYPHRSTGTVIPPSKTPKTHLAPTEIVLVDAFDSKEMQVNKGTPVAYSEMKSGHLGQGQTVSVDLNVDNPGEIFFNIKWTGTERINITLNDPDGHLIDAAYVRAHPEDVSIKRFGLAEYHFRKPAVGIWTINLTASESDVGDYGVSARFTQSNLVLVVDSEGFGGDRRYKTRFVAHLFDTSNGANQPDGVDGANAIAIVKFPQGSFAVLNLDANGTGVYDVDYDFPEGTVGLIPVYVVLTGNYHGVQYARSVFVYVQVWGRYAIKITGEHDDEIGKKDGQKTIDLLIAFTTDSRCKCLISATLMYGNIQIGYMSGEDEVSLVPGRNVVRFVMTMRNSAFNVLPIYRVNGPYTITKLTIRPDRRSPVCFVLENVWETKPYHWQDFIPDF